MTKYLCLKCGHAMNPNEVLSGSRVRCVQCGFRTLKKARPDTIRKISAR